MPHEREHEVAGAWHHLLGPDELPVLIALEEAQRAGNHILADEVPAHVRPVIRSERLARIERVAERDGSCGQFRLDVEDGHAGRNVHEDVRRTLRAKRRFRERNPGTLHWVNRDTEILRPLLHTEHFDDGAGVLFRGGLHVGEPAVERCALAVGVHHGDADSTRDVRGGRRDDLRRGHARDRGRDEPEAHRGAGGEARTRDGDRGATRLRPRVGVDGGDDGGGRRSGGRAAAARREECDGEDENREQLLSVGEHGVVPSFLAAGYTGCVAFESLWGLIDW